MQFLREREKGNVPEIPFDSVTQEVLNGAAIRAAGLGCHEIESLHVLSELIWIPEVRTYLEEFTDPSRLPSAINYIYSGMVNAEENNTHSQNLEYSTELKNVLNRTKKLAAKQGVRKITPLLLTETIVKDKKSAAGEVISIVEPVSRAKKRAVVVIRIKQGEDELPNFLKNL